MFELTGDARVSGQDSQVTDPVRGVVLTEVRTYPAFEYVLQIGSRVVHVFAEVSEVTRAGQPVTRFDLLRPRFGEQGAPWDASATEREAVKSLVEEGLAAMCDLLSQEEGRY